MNKMNKLVFSACVLLFSVGHGQMLLAAFIDTVPIGNPGNAPIEIGATPVDVRWFKTGSFGSVPNRYRIGTTEVTNDQYVTFLNAVASTDPLRLYDNSMGSNPRGGIVRTGTDGSYTYSSKLNYGNKPVNYLTLWDTMRFTNWLHNGRPSGAQDNSTTEDGAYFLGGSINPLNLGIDIPRKANARWFLPSEDEWFKAAYHKNDGVTGNYYEYPTGSDATPTEATADASGNVSNPGTNVANYNRGADWNDLNGNVTTVGSAGTTSAYGAFDLAGNVDEFTDTLLLCVDRGCSTETSQDINDLNGQEIFRRAIVRSGTWNATEDFHITGIFNGSRDVGGPNGALDNLGFRVATVATAGDYDFDGDVDGSDFLTWQRSFGSTTELNADGSGNGIVDAADLALWQAGYTSTASLTATSNNVPEPSSVIMLLASIAASICLRRR